MHTYLYIEGAGDEMIAWWQLKSYFDTLCAHWMPFTWAYEPFPLNQIEKKKYLFLFMIFFLSFATRFFHFFYSVETDAFHRIRSICLFSSFKLIFAFISLCQCLNGAQRDDTKIKKNIIQSHTSFSHSEERVKEIEWMKNWE